MVEARTLYRGDVSPEKDRLPQMSGFPHLVSTKAIMFCFGDSCDGRSVLDVGSGPDTKLAEWVTRSNGRYIAVDARLEMLEVQRQQFPISPTPKLVQADAFQLPLLDESVDISHMRFLLAHLPPNRWNDVISESARVVKRDGAVIIVEHDWGTLDSSTHGELMEEIKQAMYEFAQKFSINLFAGRELEKLGNEYNIDDTTKPQIRVERKKRPEGNYIDELLAIVGSSEKKARIENKPELADKLAKLITKIKEDPFQFVPPDIVVQSFS